MVAKRNNPLYRKWRNIISRCYMPYNNNFKTYGAKGVTVSQRWLDFDNFAYDVENHLPNGHLLYEKGYDLDKDLKGGNIYSLENCTVLLSEENRKIAREKQKKAISAKRNNEELIFDSVAEASRQLNINRGSIQQYLKRGEVHTSGYLFQYV
ncbi:hypothetical protein [Neobacillus niacini]|uniref:hypothetical protein n=1 Tax=Neobacillus niacini TaxID=86668 RepID=UPI0005EDAE4B|nr:hypothetical protein [Neobacillus niacini]